MAPDSPDAPMIPHHCDADPWTVTFVASTPPFRVEGILGTGHPFFLRSHGGRATLRVAPAEFPPDSLKWPYWPDPALIVSVDLTTYAQAATLLRRWLSDNTPRTA